MSIIKKLSSPGIVFLTLLVIIFVAYHRIFLTFYQQDEWQTLGHNMTAGWNIVSRNLSIFQILFAEGRLLSAVLYFLFLGVIKYTVVPIYLFALIVHAANATLLYRIVNRLGGSRLSAWVAALFVALNATADQTIIWISAVGTLAATMLLLCSVLWYLDFVERRDIHKRNLSFITAILSLFFKETGLFIFVFFPVLYVLWNGAKSLKEVLRAHAPLLIYGFFMISFRIYELIWTPVNAVGFISAQKENYLLSIFSHAVIYSLAGFFQTFLPPQDMYAFTPSIVRSNYKFFVGMPLFDLAAQSVVTDVVSLIGTLVSILFIGYVLVSDRTDRYSRKIVIMGVVLLALSFFPYSVLNKDFSYFSSRYYYVGAFGAAILLGYVVFWIYRHVRIIARGILIAIVSLFLFHHGQTIQRDIQMQVDYATERKAFLRELKRVKPTIARDTVFYIRSDRKYLSEITYPFQNGLGYILQILYYDTGNIPSTFLASDFLWDLGSEGFRKSEEGSFGYYEHLEMLASDVREAKFLPDIVYAYLYNSGTQTFSDITDPVREKLATLSANLQ